MVSHTAINRTRARHAAELARGIRGDAPTPAELAEHLTGYPYSTLGSLADDARVLEPSAGAGALVRAIVDAAPHLTVCAIEPDSDRAATLAAWTSELPKPGPHRAARVEIHVEPFESYAATHPADRFDAAIINPPWSTPSAPRLWVQHVLIAWRLLNPGARLVAIVPEAMADPTWRPPGDAGRDLRRLVDAHGTAETLDVATFTGDRAIRADFPTRVCLLRLVQPMPTIDGRPSWLLSPAPGQPVRVERLNIGPTGAAHTPVQAYRDRASGGTRRVLRYAGTCATCVRLLWAHDDHREDASLWTVANRVDARDCGQEGPSIGLCLDCGHNSERIEQAKRMARPYWTAL